jgi:hypothetical protein
MSRTIVSNDPHPGILDEAYERFHATGPEFDGGLSNHGPMAVEAMARHGHERAVRHKDEHAVKFADAALDSFERTGNREALAAATRATLMIEPV